MIVVMNPKVTDSDIDIVRKELESKGLSVHLSQGSTYCIIGIVGDASNIDPDKLLTFDGVDKVLKVQHPFKKANRLFKPEDSIIKVEIL